MASKLGRNVCFIPKGSQVKYPNDFLYHEYILIPN